MYLSRYLDQ